VKYLTFSAVGLNKYGEFVKKKNEKEVINGELLGYNQSKKKNQ
jgi:hypothetical protein